MKDLYAEDGFNYPDGYSLALLAATFGMVAGVVAGAILVNLAPLSQGLSAADVAAPSSPESSGGHGGHHSLGGLGGHGGRGARSDDGGGHCRSNGGGNRSSSSAEDMVARQRQHHGGSGGSGGSSPWLRRVGHSFSTSMRKMGRALAQLKETASDSDHYRPRERPSAGEQPVSVESMDSLIFHVCLVVLVMLLGYLLRTPFVLVEEFFPTG